MIVETSSQHPDPLATAVDPQPVDIRAVDLTDDDQLRQVYDARSASARLGRPDAPFWSLAEFVAAVRSPDRGEKSYLVAAWSREQTPRVLGAATVYVFLLDNLDKAWLEVAVDPAHARRGVGSALVEHACALATQQGRTVLMTDATVPVDQVADHGYRRFAERHGFTYSNVEVVRWAEVPVSEERLDAWAARAARKASGYRLRTLVDEMPPELAPSLGLLMGQLGVDAPTGAVDFEEEVITPGRLDERLATVRAMGRELYETVALDDDGQVVAQTTLVAPTDGTTDAWQWGTFVHREHRGHHLGLAVKTANLRALQAAHPEVRRLTTQNAETNDWMIAINELMGFEAVEASTEFVRYVTA